MTQPVADFGPAPGTAGLLLEDLAPPRPSGLRRRFAADRSGVVGLVIVGVLIAVAVGEPLLVPRDPLAIDPARSLQGPSLSYPFGTDNLGRDILSRVLAGTRVSVSLAILIGTCMVLIGLAIGAGAGYAGSRIDNVVMRVVDVFLAFPTLVLALAISGTLGAGYGSLVIALVATGWPAYARLFRGAVLGERNRDYVQAARGLGARPRRILMRHIVPNALSPVLVLLSFDLGTIILFIAALGYLGVGIPPPTPEWGTMISEGKDFVFGGPQMIIFPGLAIALAVVGFNLLGDGLRNALDPRHTRPPRRLRRCRWRLLEDHERKTGGATRREPGTPPPLLRVDHLTMRICLRDLEVHAVNGVSLTVNAGETVGLVGESGCGKTMTSLSILGLLPPGGAVTGGTVVFGGRHITAASEREMRRLRGNEIGMIFQDPMTSLNPTMTVGDQIAGPLRAHRHLSKKQARSRAEEVMALVGLPQPAERLDDYPHQLSGGQRQRVLIGMAIACEPKLLIADEPTTALDVTIQSQILALLADLKSRLGMGLLLLTHDMGVIAGMADRVIVMYAGRVVESAPTTALFARASHPYTQALLQSILRLEQDRSRDLTSIPGQPPDLRSAPPGCPFEPRCRSSTPRCKDEDPPLGGEDPCHPYACFHPVHHDPAPSAPGLGPAPRLEVAPVQDPPSPLVVVDHVIKEYEVERRVLGRKDARVQAVSEVSFSVGGGETFGLVGESGSGKSTIARLLVGLENPDSGAIRFDGGDLRALSGGAWRQQRRDLQLIFQDSSSSLDPRMKIGAALREPFRIHGVEGEDIRIAQALSEVGLDRSVTDLYPHQLSGGQCQRIGFARALTLKPRMLVADEPVSSLDVSIRSQILNLMKQLQVRHGLTYVLISHDLSVVRYLADRIGVMYLGKLVEVGPSDRIYGHPSHPYTAGLLASVPIADPQHGWAPPKLVVPGELPSAIDPPSGCRFRTRCARAQGLCAEQEPPLVGTGTAGHEVACHFPLHLQQ